MDAEPVWVLGASVVAIVVGTIGALLLVLRRKAAETLLLISLIGVVVWLAGMLITPMRHMLATDDIAISVIVAAITWTIYWFARHSRQRGWLN
jgi:hypothetical protein